MPRFPQPFGRALSGLAGVALGLVALVAAPAAPAVAAATTVTTIAGLETALANCATAPNTITLGADITSKGRRLTVPCDTTIDLATFDLTVANINIRTARKLTVTGPTDGTGGTLTADASPTDTNAGIRTTGATLVVTGGTVNATGMNLSAGIGGDANGDSHDAGTLIVDGGTVNAYAPAGSFGAAVGGGPAGGTGGTVTVESGSLNAYAQRGPAAAIGGSGGGANITVAEAGSLTASKTSADVTVIGGTTVAGSDFGSMKVDGVVRLPDGQLVVDTGAANPKITVGATGRILGSTADPAVGAYIIGSGRIANAGIITLDPPYNIVTGNNTVVRFDTGVASVRVFAPSFADGARTLPAPPAGTTWNTEPDGSGEEFTAASSTAGSRTLRLYAYAAGSIDVSTDPAALTATAGTPYVFPVVVKGGDGLPLNPQPAVDYTSTDCTIGANTVFTVARTCAITASTIVEGKPLQKTFSITVVPGALKALTLEPDIGTTPVGSSISYLVTGVDAWNNQVDVDGAVLTSSDTTDLVDYRTVSFRDFVAKVGDRTITAALNGVTTSLVVTVEPGPLHSLSITPSPATVTEGGTVVFTVTGADTAGNPVDVAGVVLTSDKASDAVDGRSVRFSGAGRHLITATLLGIATNTAVDVVAGPPVSLALSPSTAVIPQGGTQQFVVTGVDSGGNPADTDAAVLTSSSTADTVSGRSVTFSGAGAHTVTATLGALSATASVTVTPGPLADLRLTPATATVVQGGDREFTVNGSDAAGNAVDTGAAVLTSSSTADVIDGRKVVFSGAGTHTITATQGAVTATATVTVVPGPPAALSITPSTDTVTQGGEIAFSVNGTDAAGNPVDVSGVVLTSTGAADSVSGTVVGFSGAGPRTVTASLSGVTADAAITVVAGPLVSLTLSPSAATVVQGESQAFVVTGVDAGENPVDVSGAVVTSSRATDTVAGRSVTFSGAGSRTVIATVVSVSTTAAIEVVAGPARSLSITPSSASVLQGGTVDFVVTAADAAGNPVDTANAALTSSVDTDVVTAFSVAFPSPGVRTVTATLGALSAVVSIDVTAAPSPSPSSPSDSTAGGLAHTGSNGDLLRGVAGGALLLVLAGGLVLVRHRSARH